MSEEMTTKNLQTALEIVNAAAKYAFAKTPGIKIEGSINSHSWSTVFIKDSRNDKLIAAIRCGETGRNEGMNLDMNRFQGASVPDEAITRFNHLVATSATLAKDTSVSLTEEDVIFAMKTKTLVSPKLDDMVAGINQFLAIEKSNAVDAYKGQLIRTQGAALSA